jgi:hypothetical protein
MFEVDLLRTLERRIGALEQEVRNHQEAIATAPCLALQELKRQVDTFKKKLETTEHLSWLGDYFYSYSQISKNYLKHYVIRLIILLIISCRIYKMFKLL